jgi:hypothetical protein
MVKLFESEQTLVTQLVASNSGSVDTLVRDDMSDMNSLTLYPAHCGCYFLLVLRR